MSELEQALASGQAAADDSQVIYTAEMYRRLETQAKLTEAKLKRANKNLARLRKERDELKASISQIYDAMNGG